MSPITTHVLDTARGGPARGVPITLERLEGGDFVEVKSGITNADGRVSDLMKEGALTPGTFRITFDTGTYFSSIKTTGFYPSVPVVFIIDDATQHYHVPLLISPFGFSTYRGS